MLTSGNCKDFPEIPTNYVRISKNRTNVSIHWANSETSYKKVEKTELKFSRDFLANFKYGADRNLLFFWKILVKQFTFSVIRYLRIFRPDAEIAIFVMIQTNCIIQGYTVPKFKRSEVPSLSNPVVGFENAHSVYRDRCHCTKKCSGTVSFSDHSRV